jgi:glycosyltransferase involved in cell wall biosynthesis
MDTRPAPGRQAPDRPSLGRPYPDQPQVPGNDWRSLRPPALGGWTPTRTVSVVIPAHQAAATLPCTLAALAAQTYPAALTEVLVVDDGSDPPITLPEVRPEGTRLLRTTASWGRAHACRVGAEQAEGEVVHWLDADMLPHADELEAQMRWHHLVGYAVVLGTKTFVDVEAGLPAVDDVTHAVRDGELPALFADRWTAAHEWVEEHIERTDGLTRNPTSSYLVHVGASASVRRDLYLDSGGMDDTLKLGEDIELGYRLAQQGAVFVPDTEARSWHLGRSTLMDAQERVNDYNRPFLTDRVPDLRHWRTRGRSYTVPWIEVVVDATGHRWQDVRHSVTGALTGALSDVRALVVGPWSRLTDERRSPLSDPDRDLRLVHAELAGDPRTRFAEEVPRSSFPATYRLLLPAGWSPGPDTVRRLAREMTRKDRGLVSLLLPDGQVCRLERTSAFARAARISADGARLEDVVDAVSGTWWYDGLEEGFTHVSSVPDPSAPPTPHPSAPASATGARAQRSRRGGAPQRAALASGSAPADAGSAAPVPQQPGAAEAPAARDLLRRAIRRRPGR